MPSKRELAVGTLFFAMLAVVIVAFLRPLDGTEWFALAASVVLFVLGCAALLKGAPSENSFAGRAVSSSEGEYAAAPVPPPDSEATIEAPTTEERLVLETTLAALKNVSVLAADDVDAPMLWRAAQHLDPGEPIDHGRALDALVGLEDLGWARPRRLVFVPAHADYDEDLFAEVAAAILASLGHDLRETDISVTLPRDGSGAGRRPRRGRWPARRRDA